jgi:hypothetical protein
MTANVCVCVCVCIYIYIGEHFIVPFCGEETTANVLAAYKPKPKDVLREGACVSVCVCVCAYLYSLCIVCGEGGGGGGVYV